MDFTRNLNLELMVLILFLEGTSKIEFNLVDTERPQIAWPNVFVSYIEVLEKPPVLVVP